MVWGGVLRCVVVCLVVCYFYWLDGVLHYVLCGVSGGVLRVICQEVYRVVCEVILLKYQYHWTPLNYHSTVIFSTFYVLFMHAFPVIINRVIIHLIPIPYIWVEIKLTFSRKSLQITVHVIICLKYYLYLEIQSWCTKRIYHVANNLLCYSRLLIRL